MQKYIAWTPLDNGGVGGFFIEATSTADAYALANMTLARAGILPLIVAMHHFPNFPIIP